MAETLLERLSSTRRESEHRDYDSDEMLDLGSFGWLRGVRERAIMLEFRLKDGRITAFSYAWLERASFDPSKGITLRFAGTEVHIIGRNLDSEPRPTVQLFSGIVRHRVPWIAESSAAALMAADRNQLAIESIKLG